ncbi:hypothetical protein BDZ89DRAFT_965723, partial [Hymenopellis radicata]
MKLKLSDVETWDGDTDRIIHWFRKMDDLASMSMRMRQQLGRIVPKRLTGAASEWYWSLPFDHRRRIEVEWATLREEIAGYYMTKKWWERLRKRAGDARFRETGHTKETPSEYFIRKADLLTTAYNFNDSEMISEIMQGAPSQWNMILTTHLYQSVVDLQRAMRFHEEALVECLPQR